MSILVWPVDAMAACFGVLLLPTSAAIRLIGRAQPIAARPAQAINTKILILAAGVRGLLK